MTTDRSSRPLHLIRALLIAMALACALLAGCGQKSDSGAPATGTDSSTPPATSEPPAAAAGGDSASGAPLSADEGAKIFAARCALCHGPSGHGDGVGAKGLKPPPRNFHDAAYMKTRTDAQLLEVIHKGKGVMPAWGKVLTDAQIQAVLAHVRSFAGTP